MDLEVINIKKILLIVQSQIDAHLRFKKEYNKQLALDFNLFQFFSIGENKISQILAYFLDVNQNHGQGDIFLSEFIKSFTNERIEIDQVVNICEKIITNKRRLDIYIKIKGLTIGIENKIWADDQNNQLKDYSTFLEKSSKGNYILFYLNPYGTKPSQKSIDKELSQKLYNENKLKVISYKQDLIPLINTWLIKCEADNVSYFLKEFKKYLEFKFLGKNSLNMSKELREIIFNNEREVRQLVNEYKNIENEVLSQLNSVGKELDKIHLNFDEDIEISKSGLFNWENTRVYKYSISKNGNKIWIQFVKEEINLFSNYYLQDGTDLIFNEILSRLGVNRHKRINHNQDISYLKKVFLDQVGIAIESIRDYENRSAEE
ncbi:PD-(D/E)XK nuclease family protein [Winogradskyella sp.]|uniref:PDDEXK-like family protein n=1 Tax=Winogradskyella sp. TaxID=1883156 RepID=UPI0026059529|nr:PD-(D/E)XK nuclease family protein [Winogradskyella sp.]